MAYEVREANKRKKASRNPCEFFLDVTKLPNGKYHMGNFKPTNSDYQKATQKIYFNLDSDSSTVEQHIKRKYDVEKGSWKDVENKLAPGNTSVWEMNNVESKLMTSYEQKELNEKFQKESELFSPKKIWW
jgi:hypothetical protein